MSDKSDIDPYEAPRFDAGEPVQTMPTGARLAQTVLAAALSFMFAGAGQAYNGEWLKAILFVVGAFILWFLLLGWVVHCWAISDAAAVRWYRTGDEVVSRARMLLTKFIGFLMASALVMGVTMTFFGIGVW